LANFWGETLPTFLKHPKDPMEFSRGKGVNPHIGVGKKDESFYTKDWGGAKRVKRPLYVAPKGGKYIHSAQKECFYFHKE